MGVLHLVSYAAALVTFFFVTLSLASGLLYVAEVIEEHSQSAKKYGKQAIYTIIGAHFLFCVFDNLPVKLTLLGVFCHLVYLSNFSRSWPFISLTSPSFVASCCLVIIDHFAWFFYFAERANHPKHRQPYRSSWDDHKRSGGNGVYGSDLTFMDVATFFGLCVWLVPFFLFLSLSANDNVLPSLGEGTPTIAQQPPTPTDTGPLTSSRSLPANLTLLNLSRHDHDLHQAPRSSILKSILEVFLSALPAVRKSPFKSGRTGSRPNEGLIASPSLSAPSSPALSTSAAWGSPAIVSPAAGSHFSIPLLNGPGSPPPPPLPGSPSVGSLRPRPPTPRRAYSATSSVVVSSPTNSPPAAGASGVGVVGQGGRKLTYPSVMTNGAGQLQSPSGNSSSVLGRAFDGEGETVSEAPLAGLGFGLNNGAEEGKGSVRRKGKTFVDQLP